MSHLSKICFRADIIFDYIITILTLLNSVNDEDPLELVKSKTTLENPPQMFSNVSPEPAVCDPT